MALACLGGVFLEQFGFYGRLKEEFPSQINVDLTNICNLECAHCKYPLLSKEAGFKMEKVSVELNRKMVDEVSQFGQGITQYIRYTGDGEPLLHPNMVEILHYATSYSKTSVTLTTNGTLLNDKLCKEIMSIDLALIDISIDAYSQETYEKIRRKGNFATVCANVRNLIDLKKKINATTKIVVSFVEQPLNFHESKSFEEFWKMEGADFVIIRRLHSAGGYDGEVAKTLQVEGKNRRPCLYPWERIVLKSNGFLSYCPAEPVSELAFEMDYRIVNIKDVWCGDSFKKIRKAHLNNDLSEFKFCTQCPDWIQTRWPNEGRSYADMIMDFKGDNHDTI